MEKQINSQKKAAQIHDRRKKTATDVELDFYWFSVVCCSKRDKTTANRRQNQIEKNIVTVISSRTSATAESTYVIELAKIRGHATIETFAC